jgi:hypothetical protein
MHEEERSDARWRALMEARGEFGDRVVPLQAARDGSHRRHPSRKLAQFDEALSDWGSWSSIERPRRRLSA